MPIVNRQEFSGRVLTRRLPLLRVDAYSVPDLRAGFAASRVAAACPYVTNHSPILWLERRQGKTLGKGFARHVLVNSAVPGIENMVSTGFGLIQFTDTRLRFRHCIRL